MLGMQPTQQGEMLACSSKSALAPDFSRQSICYSKKGRKAYRQLEHAMDVARRTAGEEATSAAHWHSHARRPASHCCQAASTTQVPMADALEGVALPHSSSAAAQRPQYVQGCKLVGIGSSAPNTLVSNDELAKLVDTNDEWIASRTGIRQRHVLGKGERLSDHAVASALSALAMAQVKAEDIGLVIFATSSADDLFGSACEVAHRVGAKNALAFDLTAACSGFLLGLVTAAQFVRTGQYSNVLIIGGDALSRFVDWTDRRTCILFGDGCGAAVMGSTSPDNCAMLGNDMHSNGEGQCQLTAGYGGQGAKPYQEDGASTEGSYSNISMNGQEVFKFAVRKVPRSIKASLQQAGLEQGAIDFLVMHQANQRIMDAAAERLGLPQEKVISNIAEFGNTSAASIPLALDQAVRAGRIGEGDVLALAGFGAGLTWASAIIRWG